MKPCMTRAALVGLGLAILGAGAALALGDRPSAAPVAAPAPPPPLRAEGRVVAYPGGDVALGAEIAGRIVAVAVEERSRVRRGDALVEIDGSEQRAALAAARAAAAEAEADRAFRVRDLARLRLMSKQVVTAQQVDAAERDLALAEARTSGAAAAIRRLEAALAKTRVLAPIDGAVLARHVDPGEMVEAGQRILEVADLARLRLEVEVDEFDAGRVAPGAAVEVRAEGFDGAAWRGRVEEIPDSVVPRRVRPQDPAQFTDTRVLRVKVALLEPTPLRLGQRVEVAIERVSRPELP